MIFPVLDVFNHLSHRRYRLADLVILTVLFAQANVGYVAPLYLAQ